MCFMDAGGAQVFHAADEALNWAAAPETKINQQQRQWTKQRGHHSSFNSILELEQKSKLELFQDTSL